MERRVAVIGIIVEDYDAAEKLNTILPLCKKYGAAVDIGTTTVAALLVDTARRRVVAARGEHNAQSPYGADVISRIRHETEWEEHRNGPNPLQQAIAKQVSAMLAGLLEQAGIGDVDFLSLTGNTTMMHLLCGLPGEHIGKAPFIPATLEPMRLPAADLGIASQAPAFLLPGISAYIGADIVASLLAADAHRSQPPFLLVDLGTNAETVLCASGTLYACSAAAGPCFEGATLSCGMAGQDGAIDTVSPDPERGLSFTTIGDAPARGLCGSGVLDALALLLDAGIVDETGRLEADASPLGARITDDALTFTDSVRFTQKDIREVQLAKAAVAAGIRVLLQQRGLTPEQLDGVYLAGGFGSYLDPESAAAIGMLPRACAGRLHTLGNTALAGAAVLTLDGAQWQRIRAISRACSYLELSGRADFAAAFTENLSFPQP